MSGLVGACSNNPSPSAEVTGSAEQTLTPSNASAPAATVEAAPLPSMAPIARAPLPAPKLEAPEEIGTALFTPVSRPQGVVSLLNQLGIGTYTDAGEPITPGAEVDGGTLWLTESEVHALIEMAAAEHPLDLIEFRDWHAGLQELGLELSADELVAAYEEAYFAEGEASFFVNALFATGIDLHADGRLTHLQAWLLLLDGFVVGADAEAGGGIVLASHHEGQWGGASAFIPRLLVPGTPLNGAEMVALLARLEPIIRATPMWLEPPSATAHEGHDGPGDETSLTLRFMPLPITNPAFDLGFQLVPMQAPAGLPVTFAASAPEILAEHGAMRDPTGSDPFAGRRAPLMTDSSGTVRLTYTPREEEADGEGEVAVESVQVTASVQLREIAAHTWVLPEVLLSILIGDRAVSTTLDVEWHEAEGLRVQMTDVYDVTLDLILGVGRGAGTDTFTGFLARQDDGTWRGIVHGSADMNWSFESFESCSTPVVGTQDLLAIAAPLRNPREGGDLGIRLYPITDPVLTAYGCDYTLPRWEGDAADDPTLPRGTGNPARDYAPFNNSLVTDPELGGVPARLPTTGTETITWTDTIPGIGGGTWTVTLERVEPDR